MSKYRIKHYKRLDNQGKELHYYRVEELSWQYIDTRMNLDEAKVSIT